MQAMNMFEEKCHMDKEPHFFFGESESESIRMLASFFGRKKDNQERCVENKETIMEDKNEQINQATTVEVIVESSVQFDCPVRP